MRRRDPNYPIDEALSKVLANLNAALRDSVAPLADRIQRVLETMPPVRYPTLPEVPSRPQSVSISPGVEYTSSAVSEDLIPS